VAGRLGIGSWLWPWLGRRAGFWVHRTQIGELRAPARSVLPRLWGEVLKG